MISERIIQQLILQFHIIHKFSLKEDQNLDSYGDQILDELKILNSTAKRHLNQKLQKFKDLDPKIEIFIIFCKSISDLLDKSIIDIQARSVASKQKIGIETGGRFIIFIVSKEQKMNYIQISNNLEYMKKSKDYKRTIKTHLKWLHTNHQAEWVDDSLNDLQYITIQGDLSWTSIFQQYTNKFYKSFQQFVGQFSFYLIAILISIKYFQNQLEKQYQEKRNTKVYQKDEIKDSSLSLVDVNKQIEENGSEKYVFLESNCIICLNDVNYTSQHTIIVQECEHFYHQHCIQKQWKSSHLNNKCLLCESNKQSIEQPNKFQQIYQRFKMKEFIQIINKIRNQL